MAGTPYLIGTGSQPNGGNPTVTISVTRTTTIDDSILVLVGCVNTADDAITVFDTQNNVYNEVVGPTGTTNISGSVWQCDGSSPLVSGTDQIFVQTPSTTPTVCIAVGDNNVGLSVNPQDQQISATGSSTSLASGTTGTLSQQYEHAIAFTVNTATGVNPTWNSPWNSNVLTNTTDSGNALTCSSAYQDVSATTALDATATISTTEAWTCLLCCNQVANLTINNASLPSGIVGIPYVIALQSYGGVGTITWSLISGTLPPGLSLAGGSITGTPTTAGVYPITIQAAASTFGPTTQQQFTIVISASGVTGALQPVLYGNLLSMSDAFFSGGFTWAALTNASSVSSTTRAALSGSQTGMWNSLIAGTTAIRTGSYKVQPNKSYVLSGFVLPLGGVRNLYIGVVWQTSNGTTIWTDGGPAMLVPQPTTSTGAFWTPLVNNVTSPPNAANAEIVVWCDSAALNTVQAGEVILIQNVFLTQTNCQISIDYINPSFGENPITGANAGAAFMDVTPWVRKDQGVSYTRGRQDAISEIQAASGTFLLQNDQGIFTRFNVNSFITFLTATGGNPNLGQRVQINFSDQLGNWYTRFDGTTSEIDYSYDDTGNTCLAQYSVTDLLSYLNRIPSLRCWTYQEILSDDPIFFWPLNDYDQVSNIVSFNSNALQAIANVTTSGFSTAAEVAGFQGPQLRISNNAPVTQGSVTLIPATIAWADTTHGVETLADAVDPTQSDGGIEDPGNGQEAPGGFWVPGSNQPNSVLRGLVSGNVGPFSTPLPNINFGPTFLTQSNPNTFGSNVGWQLFAEFFGSDAFNTSNNSFTFEIFFMIDPNILNAVNGLYLTNSQNVTTPIPSANVGPFICFGLGSSRNLFNIAAGIFLNGPTSTTFQVNAYANPPAFGQKNFNVAETEVFSLSIPMIPIANQTLTYAGATLDGNGCPHHLAITIEGSTNGGTINAWVDGLPLTGTNTLPASQVFDSVFVGGPHGGGGNWYGSLSCCAIYDYILPKHQIDEHCQRGQYGAWEETTDQAILELTEFANVPSFWVNIPGDGSIGTGNALSMTEYLDLSGSNALTSMQLYEQAEYGLIFMNAQGQICYYSRDWKMGYGGPDLLLPPDTFDGVNMNYQLVDQFQVNEMAVSTITFPSGASFVNQNSIASYGIFATNPIGSPLQLPLIAFNRGAAVLGLPSLSYSAEPNLIDLASWISNIRGDPYLAPSSITIDLLAIDIQSGLTITDFYNLEVGNSIAPSGTLPVSFPNAQLSTQWFIEGMTETLNEIVHSIQYFTSPAETQIAWIPGDPIYGVLGSTTRLGISAADVNPPEPDGKDVSHDAGPPYWPATFLGDPYLTATLALSNLQAYYPLTELTAADISGNKRNLIPTNNNCVLFRVANNSPTSATNTCIQMFEAAAGVLNGSGYTPSGGNSWTFECWVNLNSIPQNVTGTDRNPKIFSSSHTTTDNAGFQISLANGGAGYGTFPSFCAGNGTTNAFVTSATPIPTYGWHYLVLTLGGGVLTGFVDGLPVGTAALSGNLAAGTSSLTIGGGTYGADYINALIAQCTVLSQTLTPSEIATRFSITADQLAMNNNNGDGHTFIGATEIRGFTWGLNKLLTPPMLVVGQQQQTQGFSEGSLTDPTMLWDSVYVDTEGGMGLVAGYPNWYVVTTPGFYEIDGCVASSISKGGSSFQSWIVVAQQGAQHLAAGTGTPIANLQYVCPVGTTMRIPSSTGAGNIVMNTPATRMYLGLGDMIAIGCNHNASSTTINTSSSNGGSFFSLRWTGLSNTGDDRCRISTAIEGGAIADPTAFPSIEILTFTNTGSSTYYGANAPISGNRKIAADNNLVVFQGGGVTTTLVPKPTKDGDRDKDDANDGDNDADDFTTVVTGNGTQYSQINFDMDDIVAALQGVSVVAATMTATNLTTTAPNTQTEMLLGLMFGQPGQSPWVLKTSKTPDRFGTGEDQNTQTSLVKANWSKGATQTVTLPVSMINEIQSSFKIDGKTVGAFLIGDNTSSLPINQGSWISTPGSWILNIEIRVP